MASRSVKASPRGRCLVSRMVLSESKTNTQSTGRLRLQLKAPSMETDEFHGQRLTQSLPGQSDHLVRAMFRKGRSGALHLENKASRHGAGETCTSGLPCFSAHAKGQARQEQLKSVQGYSEQSVFRGAPDQAFYQKRIDPTYNKTSHCCKITRPVQISARPSRSSPTDGYPHERSTAYSSKSSHSACRGMKRRRCTTRTISAQTYATAKKKHGVNTICHAIANKLKPIPSARIETKGVEVVLKVGKARRQPRPRTPSMLTAPAECSCKRRRKRERRISTERLRAASTSDPLARASRSRVLTVPGASRSVRSKATSPRLRESSSPAEVRKEH